MAVDPVPVGKAAVIPSLVLDDCAAAIDWYVEVLGATEIAPRMVGPDGLVAHAEIEIAGCVVMLGDEWPDGPVNSPKQLGGSTAALFVYVDNARELFDRALANGAEEVFPYELQFYGDEGGRIRDPWGMTWGLGRHVEDVSDEEMQRRMAAFYEEQAD